MSLLAKNEMCYVYQIGPRIFSIAFLAHGKLGQYHSFHSGNRYPRTIEAGGRQMRDGEKYVCPKFKLHTRT